MVPAALVTILGCSFVRNARALFSRNAKLRRRWIGRSLSTLRDWSPLLGILTIYDNFHDLTSLIRPHVVDAKLRLLDETIFGATPSLFLQRFATPALTEYMTFAYALFFVFPIIILTALYCRGEVLKFREFGLALSLAFYLGLIGYMLVPAVGPRFYMAHEFTVPLEGYWITAPARAAWSAIETVDRDCFPSLHTAISSICLVYFWRWRRSIYGGTLLFIVALPLIVSLWMSTLYLRYHYGVDVLAGFFLAQFCVTRAPQLVAWYYRNPTARAAIMRPSRPYADPRPVSTKLLPTTWSRENAT